MDAPIPAEACNFLERQRELFATRRKNKADAIEFLHQFRADDDFVFRTARRSLDSTCSKHSGTKNYEQPDARASVYSYAVYPIMTQTERVNKAKRNDESPKISTLKSSTNSHDIITTSICFESAFEALKLTAKEASRHPLPDDSDVDNNNDRDNNFIEKPYILGEHSNAIQGSNDVERVDTLEYVGKVEDHLTYESLEDKFGKGSLSAFGQEFGYDNHNELEETMVERNKGECNSILIIEGEVDVRSLPDRGSDCVIASESSTSPFIPFEAFTKLGESLVVSSHELAQSKDSNGRNPFPKDESDDETTIPGESFMQLGASMMTNDLLSLKDEVEKQSTISNESQQTQTNTLDFTSHNSTDAKSSLANMDVIEQKNGGTIDDNMSELSKCSNNHPRKDRNDLNDNKSENHETNIHEETQGLCEDTMLLVSGVNQHRDTNRKSNIQNLTLVSHSPTSCDNTRKEEVEGIDNQLIESDVAFENIGTPKISNPADGGFDDEGKNVDDSACGEEESLQMSGPYSNVNGQITDIHQVEDIPRNVRRNRRKKKKIISYYPSSSWFVSWTNILSSHASSHDM